MSTFVFNPAGLETLVRGPVRREVERRARVLADDAQANIALVIQRGFRPDVRYSMQSDDSAVVGLLDEGLGEKSVSSYLDKKAKREYGTGTPGDWMRTALVFTFPS